MSFLWCARSNGRVSDSPLAREAAKKNRPASLEERKYKPVEDTGSEEGQQGDPEETTAMPPIDQLHKMIEFHPDPAHYQIYTVIGRGCGSAATVSLARHVPSGSPVAVKRINLDQCEVDFGLLQHEMVMHRLMNHESIMEVLCTFIHNNVMWCIMPLAAFGSCKDLLHAHFVEGLPEIAIAIILRDVLTALEYIHSRGIIHRTIRASHILLTASGRVCLTGLRHSYCSLNGGRRLRSVHDFPTFYEQSLLWASPELLGQNLTGYDTNSDIYSVGITACELANGVVPFADMPATQMLLEKLEGVTPRLLDTSTIPEYQMQPEETVTTISTTGTQADSGIGESVGNAGGRRESEGNAAPYRRTFSSFFHEFVQLCLESDPKQRPNATTLLQHAFFRQLKKRPSSENLCDLLHPIMPITDFSSLPREEPDVDALGEQLEGVEVEDNSWLF